MCAVSVYFPCHLSLSLSLSLLSTLCHFSSSLCVSHMHTHHVRLSYVTSCVCTAIWHRQWKVQVRERTDSTMERHQAIKLWESVNLVSVWAMWPYSTHTPTIVSKDHRDCKGDSTNPHQWSSSYTHLIQQHAFQLCVKVWEVVTMYACVNGD